MRRLSFFATLFALGAALAPASVGAQIPTGADAGAEGRAAPPLEPPPPEPAAPERVSHASAEEERDAPGPTEHVVRAHETLGGIAHHYGLKTSLLAAANGIKRSARIRVGQKLTIPAKDESAEEARVHLKPLAETESGIQELPIRGSAPAYYYEPTGPGRLRMRPVIVYLHGRGAEPKYYCERWSRVARNLGWLVCPSGPEDRGGGKRGWNNNWVGGQNIVMEAIDGLRRRYGRRVQLYGNTLIGFSEGAFVAMNVGLREPHTFNRWLILGADSDYWGAAGLASLPEARGRVRRVYLITGEHDDVVDDAAQVRRWLAAAGVPVRVSTPKDMGHEVALDTKPAMYQAALRWLAQG